MLRNDPYAMIVQRELEERWERAAQARLPRETKAGRVSAGPQPARLPVGPSRLRRFADRMLGRTPAPGFPISPVHSYCGS
jgi:hypothetical protein